MHVGVSGERLQLKPLRVDVLPGEVSLDGPSGWVQRRGHRDG